MNRAGLAALVCVALAAVLVACGGGSSGSDSTGGAGSPAPRLGGSATGSGPKTSEPRKDSGSSSAPSGSTRGVDRRAQGAAAFLVPQGDNSIPTYGAEASSSELAAATESLATYLAARASRDWVRACSHLGAPIQKQLELLARGGGEGCAASYAQLASHIGSSQLASPLVKLAALRVEGDKAFALFYGPGEQQYMMPMVSEGGSWKANQLEPVPWPIGSAGLSSP